MQFTFLQQTDVTSRSFSIICRLGVAWGSTVAIHCRLMDLSVSCHPNHTTEIRSQTGAHYEPDGVKQTQHSAL